MGKINLENNTNELLVFVYKHRKTLIITGIVAGIASIIISLFLTVLYQSTAIVFPTATSTVSFNAQTNTKASAMDFGEEENAEQLIQILESSKLRNRIIDLFDLASVYDIKPDEKNYHFELNKKYKSRIKFERTRYGSIDISVLDEKPERAANIANKIVDLIDTLKNELVKERTIPAFEINKRKLNQLEAEQNQLNAEIDSLSRLGVVDARTRGSLIEAINEVKSAEYKKNLMDQIEVNRIYGTHYDALVELREFRVKKLTEQEISYEQAESDAKENFNHKFIVESAFPADKKAKPKRSIVVLVSTISALILMFIFLLIRERFQEIKFKE